jgi:hypothetical protein
MIICQWHLDILYGKQAEAVRIMRAWGAEKLASSEFRRVRSTRLLAGLVGASASRLIDNTLSSQWQTSMLRWPVWRHPVPDPFGCTRPSDRSWLAALGHLPGAGPELIVRNQSRNPDPLLSPRRGCATDDLRCPTPHPGRRSGMKPGSPWPAPECSAVG